MTLVFILLAVAILSASIFFVPVRMKYPAAMVLTGTGALAVTAFAVRVLVTGSDMVAEPSFVPLFRSAHIRMDALSALFAAVICVAVTSAAVYAGGYLKRYAGSRNPSQFSIHYVSLVLLFVSLVFVVMVRDAYGFLFSWELMTVASFVLILFYAERREVRKAAINYLVLMHVGFVLILTGFVAVSAAGLPSSLDSLAGYFSTNNPIPLFLVFLAGFGMKAGMFPLHAWLPEAHPAAPAHVSAIMSGVMTKMGIYGLIRVLLSMEDGALTAGMILFSIGIVTGLWGAILAAVQNEMKRLLAYSTIENMGIIFMALGAAAIGQATGNRMLALCAMSGAILHVINHSLFKPLLFFGAGSVYSAAHTTSLGYLGGLSRRMPVTAGFFLVGVVAVSSLPPLSGFISEFLIYYGFFDTLGSADEGTVVSIAGITVLSLIGGIVLLAFTKLYGVVFLGSPRSAAAREAEEAGRHGIVACILPLAGILTIGLAPFMVMGNLFSLSGKLMGMESVSPYWQSLYSPAYGITATAGVLILSVAALTVYRHYLLRNRIKATGEWWSCGFSTPTSRMQYSGESFSEGLYGISAPLTKSAGKSDVIDKNEIFPTRHSFDIRHRDRVSAIFYRWLLDAVRWIDFRVTRLSTGNVNHYILYALLFLALVMILSAVKLI